MTDPLVEAAVQKMVNYASRNTPNSVNVASNEGTVEVGFKGVQNPDQMIEDIRVTAGEFAENIGVQYDTDSWSSQSPTSGCSTMLSIDFSVKGAFIHPGVAEEISKVNDLHARTTDSGRALELRWAEGYDVEETFEDLAGRGIYPSEFRWEEKAVICRKTAEN